jgi:hypothetical protein
MTDELIIIPVPSLIATLISGENRKGSPLTENEVNEIRNNCPSIAMTIDQYNKVSEARGYHDINPEQAWKQWSDYKLAISAQQVDSAEASTIAVPPSDPSGSPR